MWKSLDQKEILLAASSDPTGAQQSNREMASLPSSGHLHAGAITPELWHQLAISFLWTRQGLLAHHALLQKLATESMQAHLPVLCETVGYKPAIGIRGPPGGVGTAAPHTTAAAVNAPKGEEKIPTSASSSPEFLMMYSAFKSNKQGGNMQP